MDRGKADVSAPGDSGEGLDWESVATEDAIRIVTDSTDESELSGEGEGLEADPVGRVNWGGALAFGVTEVASLC